MSKASEVALLDYVRSRMLDDPTIAIDADTELFADRIIDSMNVLGFIGYLEARLHRRLNDHELVMANFRTVRTICERFLDQIENREIEDDAPNP